MNLRTHRLRVSTITIVAFLAAGCSNGTSDEKKAEGSGSSSSPADTSAAQDEGVAATARSPLAGTSWRLIEFQSMDDATEPLRPEDPSRFTMRLDADGSVHMTLDCNRATGTWSIDPSADPTNGRFRFGPLAATRAMCPPPNIDELITRQAEYVRGYLLRDGNLYLSLMADGGIFAWEPM